MKLIKCDVCKKTLEEDKYIFLGTESGKTLSYENRLERMVGQIISLSRYRDLHFCSKEHFMDYLFENDKKP